MSIKLKYSFLPNSVFVNSVDDLKLVAENPISSGSSIQFKAGRGGDSINVVFPIGDADSDLASSLNFGVGNVTSPFTCTLVGGNFVITATQDTQIDPGETISVEFTQVPINESIGDSFVAINEYVDGGVGTTSVKISKIPEELGVIVWLDPLIVGLNQESLLQFKSAASTNVVISGYPKAPGEKTFETPPYSASDKVIVGSDTESQRTYTATAWAGTNQSIPQSITLTQVPPVITIKNPSEEQIVGAGEKVVISWKAMYSTSSVMKWLQSQIINPNSPLNTVPGEELTKVYNIPNHNADFMPDTVTYTLTVEGFKESAICNFVFKVNPVQLVYIKYKNPDLTEIMFAIDPSDWRAVSPVFATDSLTLTIYQPGFTKDLYYLSKEDTVNPMIQYFDIVDGDLSWITANLKSLTLDPGNISISDIEQGTHVIPSETDTVVLTGIGNNGKTIRSVLKISESKVE